MSTVDISSCFQQQMSSFDLCEETFLLALPGFYIFLPITCARAHTPAGRRLRPQSSGDLPQVTVPRPLQGHQPGPRPPRHHHHRQCRRYFYLTTNIGQFFTRIWFSLEKDWFLFEADFVLIEPQNHCSWEMTEEVFLLNLKKCGK